MRARQLIEQLHGDGALVRQLEIGRPGVQREAGLDPVIDRPERPVWQAGAMRSRAGGAAAPPANLQPACMHASIQQSRAWGALTHHK